MTACASPSPTTGHGNEAGQGHDDSEEGALGDGARTRSASPPGCVITADGSYGARLALAGDDAWFPERWTLDGPEPYAVPLPANQPEEPGTEVLPLTDGRVLIHRPAAERHLFSLLYPTGPGTGELLLGAVECLDPSTELRLLPPGPCGEWAYALAVGPSSTAVWLVAGGAFGPERVAEVAGRCSGGVWLDGAGRLLALDRESDGRTKTVVVDLERGEVSPLLQIADDSDDRLLLADPDSGLLLISSDAPSPGRDRLGWGVLGSTLPVRFPECLRVPDGHRMTPFAIQPGQILTPESCAVALRVDGARGSWVGLWRPASRQVHHLPAPEGWLTGAGLWTRDGVLHLPYATGAVGCGVARVGVPWGDEPDTCEPAHETTAHEATAREGTALGEPAHEDARGVVSVGAGAPAGAYGAPDTPGAPGTPGPSDGAGVAGLSPGAERAPVGGLAVAARPVPLQQAPLIGRVSEEVTVG
ncbi:hypothetical protein [Streptomyces heilongjiangensis]|uniref:Uncharacterized protein n=1 Tax=Streptomyces heilongjiangensis TaxID=945052 RepID=A0ABW1B443_9ACTN|nr:hypothetical protein [Streptomyces heilongjiangensis]MDC2951971.1 hypothetical protein [Streptomyces heilongjiangensis]